VTPGLGVTNFTAANGTTPDTLSFTYTTAAPWTSPQSELDVATNGTIIPFNVTAANASGGSSSGGATKTPVWLRVGPPGPTTIPSLQTSGQASPGSDVPIIVSLDQTAVQSLLPGSYGGVVTFAALNKVNGSHTVAVNLVISAGAPGVTSIFPTSVIQAPAVNPLITINGQNFFSTSVATIAQAGTPKGGQCTQSGTPVQLTSQLLSQTVMLATITNAATLFANAGQWCICVTNPAPANAPGQPPACIPAADTFTVISSSQMAITSVLNAASGLRGAKQAGTNADPVAAGQTSVAPGEIVSIFGQNLGPAVPFPAIPVAAPGTAISSTPLVVLNTASLLGSPAVTLQFHVTAAGGGNVSVICDFTGDLKVGAGEALSDVVAYINKCTTNAGLGSMASYLSVAGNTYLALTTPTSGSAAGIALTDNAASQLLKLTSGSNVNVNGSDVGFPTQLANIQVEITYTDTTVSPGVIRTLNAPLIMVSNNQINAMLPFELSNGSGGTASLTVLSSTGSASTASLLIVDENPGIFTMGGSGTGQAAVLNYSATTGAYSINSSSNTAPRGSTIVIYGTGLGVLSAPQSDTAPAATAVKTNDPVQVIIGGQPAVVTYAGTSPGSIGGLAQINAIVPPTVPTGQSVSLVIAGGTAATARESQTGVTLAVK